MTPPPSPARILVIEDEEALRLALADALAAEGYTVLTAADGVAGEELALSSAPDLVLLDLMLPRRDGFEVLRSIRRERTALPVLILSARGEEWDRIQGFEYGADDYLVKPFSMRELLLRVGALLRRAGAAEPGRSARGRARFGEVEVDFAGYSLVRGRTRHGLSRRELELLRFFLDHPGQVLARNRILDEVWGRDAFPTPRTVDTHVLKLRKKIEERPERPRHLLTVHGVGYKFSPEGEDGA
ncbi:MAG: DNA-binding response regulator [Planctomycetota bacterium]|nr:MAG: DNA-binding response regulator [Planctomycetota bacterium]